MLKKQNKKISVCNHGYENHMDSAVCCVQWKCGWDNLHDWNNLYLKNLPHVEIFFI